MRPFAIALLALLTGCATGIRVDYGSDPIGATVYEDGRSLGTTPMSVRYEPDETFKRGGCMRTKGTSAVWASGARAQISYLELCASRGMVQNYVYGRPDVPGREIDANFALQLQRNAIMRQQANSAATANYLMLLNANRPAPPSFPQQTNCRTVYSGNVANTQCY